MAWQQLTIKTSATQAEELSNTLWKIGALSTSFVDDKDDPIYEPDLDTTELWNHTDVVALFPEDTDLAQIITYLVNLEQFGKLEFIQEFIPDQDWERSWMDQYHPMQFGDHLWICPTNDKVVADNAIVVSLDPGLAFGTGTHPTTRMCLQWLDYAYSQQLLQDKIVIDYGCGSGVLAIAALKLGAKQVIGVDIDPQAIEASTNNAQQNGVADKLSLYLAKDFDQQTVQADIVLANILAGPLVELAPRLTSLLKTGGNLTLSGILDEKEAQIITAYQDYIQLEPCKHDQEWLMFTGTRK